MVSSNEYNACIDEISSYLTICGLRRQHNKVTQIEITRKYLYEKLASTRNGN